MAVMQFHAVCSGYYAVNYTVLYVLVFLVCLINVTPV